MYVWTQPVKRVVIDSIVFLMEKLEVILMSNGMGLIFLNMMIHQEKY